MPTKSLTGGQFPVGIPCVLGRVCWFSRTQNALLSQPPAGYVALANTTKESMFIRYAWGFIFTGFGQRHITVFEDDEGARPLAQNPVCTSNSKHTDARHHFFAGAYLQGGVCYYSCRFGAAACRLLNNAAQQHG